MADSKKKPILTLIIIAAIILVAGALLFRFFSARANALPKGIASGNGRIEAEQVQIAAKEALRVEQIFVSEGDLVHTDQVLVKLNTATLDSELAQAKANVTAVQQNLAIETAAIQRRRSDVTLAQSESERLRKLVASNAGSQREYESRQADVKTALAALKEEQARFEQAQKAIEVALANVGTIQTRIKDATLVSPVEGRVLYRLAEPGEVLAAGGSALTIVDLGDVYMEIFLPSNQAAALKIGGEARIVLDYLPDWALPATVSFVSPEAQFTPKQVETRSEREMLMFRIKLQIPHDIVLNHIDQIKTGVRGVGYVKIDPSAQWPKHLQNWLTVNPNNRSSK
jgi:HlyD family secretion protein